MTYLPNTTKEQVTKSLNNLLTHDWPEETRLQRARQSCRHWTAQGLAPEQVVELFPKGAGQGLARGILETDDICVRNGTRLGTA